MDGAHGQRGRRRAFALLFALGILVLLSVFALSFANLTRLERLAAANVRTQTQAARLAEAGVSCVIATARDAARSRHFVDPTIDWWAVGTPFPKLNVGELGQVMAFNEAGGQDVFNVVSFDTASKIDLNTPTPNLRRAIEIAAVDVNPQVIDATTLTTLLTKRDERGGFKTRDEVRQIVGDQIWFEKGLRDIVTVYSTPRLEGIQPISGQLPLPYDSGARRALSYININGASENVLAGILANLEGHAIEVQSENITEWLDSDFASARGRVQTGTPFTLSEAKARKIAKHIVACRSKQGNPDGISYGSQPYAGPFETWQQFDEFLVSLDDTTICNEEERSLIMAATHVDARYMGYNPETTRRRGALLIDRFCLTKLAAPLSLVGSGTLEVRSRGWCTSADDDITTTDVATDKVVLADYEVEQVVRVFLPRHFTTQRELLKLFKDGGNPSTTSGDYQLGPELVPMDVATSDRADPIDGFLRLTTEHTDIVGDMNVSSAFRDPGDPPGQLSFTRATGTDPLRRRGVFGCDGVNVWRKDWESDSAQLVGSNLPASMAQRGSFELWLKLAADQTQGTDEALVTIVVDDTESWPPIAAQVTATIQGNPDAVPPIPAYQFPSQMGATIKLERFRGRLRATWFYWGSGNGSISRFALALSEVQRDISSWLPGEWHHVVVSWNNTGQDWSGAQGGDPLTVGDVAATDGVKLLIDGTSAPILSQFPYASLESRGFEGVFYHMGKCASVDRTERVTIGGYAFNAAGSGTAGMEVHSTGVMPSIVRRYTNATIDDLVIYNANVTTAPVAKQRTSRFERNVGMVSGAKFKVPLGPDPVGCFVVEYERPPTTDIAVSIPQGTGSVRETTKNEDGGPHDLIFTATQVQEGAVDGHLTATVFMEGDGIATPYLERFTLLTLPPVEVLEETTPP